MGSIFKTTKFIQQINSQLKFMQSHVAYKERPQQLDFNLPTDKTCSDQTSFHIECMSDNQANLLIVKLPLQQHNENLPNVLSAIHEVQNNILNVCSFIDERNLQMIQYQFSIIVNKQVETTLNKEKVLFCFKEQVRVLHKIIQRFFRKSSLKTMEAMLQQFIAQANQRLKHSFECLYNND